MSILRPCLLSQSRCDIKLRAVSRWNLCYNSQLDSLCHWLVTLALVPNYISRAEMKMNVVAIGRIKHLILF